MYFPWILLDGPPATLVGLIGYKQYRRCARDIYYFTQVEILSFFFPHGLVMLILVSYFHSISAVIICTYDFALQSAICIKQLAYAILERLLISVFPELRDLVMDLHGKNISPLHRK